MKAWMLAGIAGALALGGCVDRAAQEQAKRTETLVSDTTVAVTVEPVKVQNIAGTIELTGQVTASMESSVGAKVAGRLAAVYVRDGDPVVAGQAIAQQETTTLRDQAQQALAQVKAAQAALAQAETNARVGPQRSAAGVATAQAQLNSAKAQLSKARTGARTEEIRRAEANVRAAESGRDTAKREFDRVRGLYKEGAVSLQRLDQAQNAYALALAQYDAAVEALGLARNATRPEDLASAEEAVRQAEENLRNAKAQQSLDALFGQAVQQARANLEGANAQLRLANQALEDATLRAPFSGKVSGSPSQPGQFLAPGSPVARIVGSGNVYFEAEIPETSLEKLAIGTPVSIRIAALGGRLLSGRIAAIRPKGDEVGRVFYARVTFIDEPGELYSGMFGSATVEFGKVEGATVVPASAIVIQGDNHYVFLHSDGKAKRVKVVPGIRVNGLYQVEGLSENDQVIVQGANLVIDGSKVRVEKPGVVTAAQKSGEGA